MCIGLVRLQSNVYARLLRTQRISRYLSSVAFEDAYRSATEEELSQLLISIDKLDEVGIENWVYRINRRERNYERLTMKELRELAKSVGIRYYKWKTQQQLLVEIYEREEKNYAESSTRANY